MHRQHADRRGEAVILKSAQRRLRHKFAFFEHHRIEGKLVQDGGDGIGETHILASRRLDAIVNADAFDRIHSISSIARLDVGDAWCRPHAQHCTDPRFAEGVMQLKLLASGVEQPAHIGVVNPGLKTSLHHGQVGVVHRGVQAGVSALQRPRQCLRIVQIGMGEFDLRAPDRLDDGCRVLGMHIRQHHLIHARIPGQRLHRDAAHLPRPAQYGDLHAALLPA